jgi:chemotaxis protein MotB
MILMKKNRRIHAEEDSEGSWAVSYGDMITLLLSFFVIFYNADFKAKKIESLNHHLSFDLENLKPHLTGSSTASASTKPNEKAKTTKSKETVGSGSILVDGFSDYNIKVHEVDQNLVVTFGNISFFDSGSIEVKKDTIEILKLFTSKYLPYAGKYQLSIKGFTDRKPVRKDRRNYKDNLELSVLRAVSAMRHLQKAGIPLNRMEIAGVGELRTIEKIIPKSNQLNQKELDALSRTVMLVIKPEKESQL